MAGKRKKTKEPTDSEKETALNNLGVSQLRPAQRRLRQSLIEAKKRIYRELLDLPEHLLIKSDYKIMKVIVVDTDIQKIFDDMRVQNP